jgi:hypothetical protein
MSRVRFAMLGTTQIELVEGPGCRACWGSISVVRDIASLPTAQEPPSEGRGVNLTSVPWRLSRFTLATRGGVLRATDFEL